MMPGTGYRKNKTDNIEELEQEQLYFTQGIESSTRVGLYSLY